MSILDTSDAKPKIDKLTSEQEALIPKVRQEWIDASLHSRKRVEFEDIEQDIEWIYNKIGMKKPLILIFDSYLAQKLAINTLIKGREVESQVWSQVWSQVQSQVWSQVRSQVRSQVLSQVGFQVESRVWSQVESQVWSQVESQVESPVRSQVGSPVQSRVESPVRSQVGSNNFQFVEQRFGLGYDAGWLSFYDLFRRIGVVKSGEFDRYANFLRKGIWSVAFFDKAVFICRLPTKVMKDDEGRLHSVTQGAVQSADGLDNHFVNGVGFDKPLWSKIVSKSIKPKDAILLENIEQRTIALQVLGYDHVLQEIGANVVDSMVDIKPSYTQQLYALDEYGEPDFDSPTQMVTHPSKTLHYEVLETNLEDDNSSKVARFVKVECPSTGKEAILRVDPNNEATRTCKGAVAWSFGMTPEEYDPLVET